MKTAIVYYSQHHGNTRKLLDAIAEKNEVTIIDVVRDKAADISEYDRAKMFSSSPHVEPRRLTHSSME